MSLEGVSLKGSITDMLHAMVEFGQDIIILYDSRGRCIFNSSSHRTILGYDAGDIFNQQGIELIHPDDRESIIDSFYNVLSTPSVRFASQWRQRHEDGHYLWMEGTCINKLQDPNIKAIICNYRDISAHMEANQKLQQSNAELTKVFNNIDEVIYSARRNPYKVIQWSEACNKVYGYTSEEFIQAGFLWYEVILPEDKHMIDELNDMLETGQVSTVQYRIRHRDGRIRWIEACVTPSLNERGEITRVDGVNRDITDKKIAENVLQDSERKFRALIEKSKDGIALTDRDGIIRYVSPAIYSILGYDPSEVTGYTPDLFMYPGERDEVNAEKKMLPPGATLSQTVKARHKDGSLRWLEITATNQLDNPAVNAIVSNLQDVTERKKIQDELFELNRSLEEKVKERTEQLEESNRALESFSSMAAHDLQSPLRVLSGYVGLLKREYEHILPPDGLTLMDVIAKQTYRMKDLVTDLLTFSRASHAAVERREVDMTHLVQEKVNEQILARSGQSMPEIVVHDLGSAHCDEGLMHEVWSNLISNAIKYSIKSKAPRVQIGTRQQDDKVYYISDNGVGFDPRAADKMFQLFQRLHSSADFEGTGLGLALVKSIITKHNGRIWAESTPGQGATFYFTLQEASLDHA